VGSRLLAVGTALRVWWVERGQSDADRRGQSDINRRGQSDIDLIKAHIIFECNSCEHL
jgi:hypothetical protein